jgi:hypothetical protein
MISAYPYSSKLDMEPIPIQMELKVYSPGLCPGIEREGYEMISMFVTGCVLIGLSVFIRKISTTD